MGAGVFKFCAKCFENEDLCAKSEVNKMNTLLKNADKLIHATNVPDLSLYAKGLYAYMLLNPDKDIWSELKEGCSQVDGTEVFFGLAINELVNNGYVRARKEPTLKAVT